MAILVETDTRILVQGITGDFGSRHAKASIDYGTQLVAGVTPGKGGQIFEHSGKKVPVFDTVAEAAALADFNGLAATTANEVLLSLCGSTAWAKTMGAHRPYKSVRSLMKAAEGAWWGLGENDWREAFAAHPKIGEQKKAVTATVQSASWSTGEQSGVTNATVDVGERLAALNARYLEVHGFIYIVCASGKSAAQLLSLLESRIDNPTSVELDRAAREQMQITRLRLEKWLKSAMNKGA